MLTWPHANSDWRSRLAAVDRVFVNLSREIAAREKLLVNCYDNTHRQHVQWLLEKQQIDLTAVTLHIAVSNDSWARDHGPVTILENNHAQLLDFTFNGWGNRYPAELDNAITQKMAAHGLFGQTPLTSVDLVMEGGSLESDGAGTLLTTSQCLLHGQRNPSLDQDMLERRLGEIFGIERFLWLESGKLIGDDTDSHIDMLARFVNPQTIVYQSCDETAYRYYADLKRMETELENLKRADGEPYQLHALPWPAPKTNAAGERLPASYANFLIINGAVLVPGYADPADVTACDIIQSAFPEREVISIDCRPLIEQAGSLHCVTMQFPEAVALT